MLRSLSSLESFFVDHDITIVTVSDLQGTVNALVLQKAIDMVVMMHPLLSSEVLQSDEGYYFSKREAIDDQLTVLGEIDKDARKQIMLTELNTPLDKKSLIRCTLLLEERIGFIKPQNISFITNTHHAVSDGISCAALHEQIWKVYAEMINGESPTVTEFPLMPAIETLIPSDFSEAELEEYIERYAATAKQFSPFAITPAEKGDASVEMGYVRKKFSLKQTRALLAACKENNVSVHGAICAANLLAMRDLFGAEGALDLSCHSPINIRARLTPAIENNAMFSAAVGCAHYQTVTPDLSLWELGANISNTITEHIASGDIFKSLLTYKETRLKSNLATSIGVTNVGVLNLPNPSRKLKFVALNFIPRIPLPMLSACVITTDDKLTITYPYAKPFFSTNIIKKLAEQAANYLLF